LETHDVFPYRFFPRKNMWSPGVFNSDYWGSEGE
jgi:hypothetical protein